ncbi:MAG: hypothetical protein AB1330_01280 [Bacillota bacterium]
MILELQNLPGSRRVYRDYNLQVAEAAATGVVTDSVLLIGTAVDGPVDVPVQLNRLVDAELFFGKSVDASGLPNGMSLVRAAKELYSAGCRDIRLMRVGGEYARGSVTGQPVAQTVTKSHQEDLGQASGNDAQTVALDVPDGDELAFGTVEVLVDGVIQQFGFTVDYDANAVAFQANWFRSNAEYRINYQYNHVIATHDIVGEELLREDDYNFRLLHGPIVYGTLAVFVDGVEQPATSPDGSIVYWTYDEAANKITFVDPVAVDAVVTANYSYEEIQITSASVTGVLSGSPQIFNLDYAPVAGTFVLKANDAVVPSTGYTLNEVDKTVILLPGNAPLLATISAQYNYTSATTVIPALDVRGMYPGEIYNTVVVNLTVTDEGLRTLSFTKPSGKPGESFTVDLSDLPNLGKVVETVNRDPRNTFVRLSTNVPDFPPGVLDAATVILAGGTDGPKPSDWDYKDKMYTLLEKAYAALYDYDVDFVVPLDVYADDPLPDGRNFAEQLAKFCAVVSMANSEVLGIISVKPLGELTPEAISAKVDALCAEGKNEYYLKDDLGNYLYDDDGNRIDIGRFIQVHAGPEPVFENEQLGVYAAPAGPSYAGIVSMLPPHHGPAGHMVTGSLGLRFSYSYSQLNRLLGSRYVTFHVRPGANAVQVTDGLTAACPASDYRRLTTMRIVAAAVELVRQRCEPFYGLPNTPEHRGAMATAIEDGLKAMKFAGALLDFQFQIFASVSDQVLGRCMIDLKLVPAFEVVQIKTTVTLRPALGTVT